MIKQHDEQEAGERRYLSEAFMLELETMNNTIEVIDEEVILPEFAAASAGTTDSYRVERLHDSAGRDRGANRAQPIPAESSCGGPIQCPDDNGVSCSAIPREWDA